VAVDPLSQLSFPARDWFETTLGAPTRAQTLGLPSIIAGHSTLLLSPTGSGKTLAAFLSAVDRLMNSPEPTKETRCRVLYVSPNGIGTALVRSQVLPYLRGLAARGVDGPVLVVRAPGHQLPALPEGVEVLDDPTEGLGPLQGIAVGLAALEHRVDVAFVCATDVPFLHPAFARRVLRAWADSDPPWDVVLPVARGHAQPLAAAYRPVLAPLAAKLVAADRLRPAFLFDECSVLRLDDDALLSDPQLQAADPHLDSVVNLNGPDDYTEAHARPVPQVTVECFGVLATNHGRGQRAVRAATVAGRHRAAVAEVRDDESQLGGWPLQQFRGALHRPLHGEPVEAEAPEPLHPAAVAPEMPRACISLSSCSSTRSAVRRPTRPARPGR